MDRRGNVFEVRAVGRVHSSRAEIVDDDWGEVEATISLLPPFEPESLAGLTEFSHLEVLYLFHEVDSASVCNGARHPRGRPDWPLVGIFAQRAKDRPNRLGLTTAELIGVEGTSIRLRGLDALDGTPVLDIKPYMEEFGPRTAVREPRWARELMADYF